MQGGAADLICGAPSLPLGLKKCLPIVERVHPNFFQKQFGEIVHIVIANGLGDVLYRVTCVDEQPLGLTQPLVDEVINGGNMICLPEFPADMSRRSKKLTLQVF